MGLDVAAAMQAAAQQQNATAVSDGQHSGLRSTRVGQIFTANWKTELVLSGYAFNVTVGGVTGGADVGLIVGGGNGTTIDSDQPEMAIGTPAGYFHIPLGFTATVQGDSNADADVANILLFADTTQIIPLPIAASSTVETPHNLLDGAATSVSYAQSAVTTDITDPIVSIILGYATCRHAQVTAASTVIQALRLDYDPSYPTLLKGPCSVVACWGGTNAQSGMCSYNWAEVPIARYA